MVFSGWNSFRYALAKAKMSCKRESQTRGSLSFRAVEPTESMKMQYPAVGCRLSISLLSSGLNSNNRLITEDAELAILTRTRSATATGSERQPKWKCFNHGKT